MDVIARGGVERTRDGGVATLEQKADVNTKNNGGWTALHGAASMGHEGVVWLLLEHKADFNTKDNGGWTAIHEATSNGHDTAVQLLKTGHSL